LPVNSFNLSKNSPACSSLHTLDLSWAVLSRSLNNTSQRRHKLTDVHTKRPTSTTQRPQTMTDTFYRRKQQTIHARFYPISPNRIQFITVAVTFLLLLARYYLYFLNYAIQSNKKFVTNCLERLTETLVLFLTPLFL
jgi:hypothetical protein